MTSQNSTAAEDAAKREGYIQGRNDENYVQNTVRRNAMASRIVEIRESSGMGTIFGLVIALLAMGVGALFFFANTDSGSDIVPVAVPEIETDITPDVELPDVNVEVPDVEVPDVNITDVEPSGAE